VKTGEPMDQKTNPNYEKTVTSALERDNAMAVEREKNPKHKPTTQEMHKCT
jgi:hypothetical protein